MTIPVAPVIKLPEFEVRLVTGYLTVEIPTFENSTLYLSIDSIVSLFRVSETDGSEYVTFILLFFSLTFDYISNASKPFAGI